ncbi:MAG: threonine--tRNA ligase [Legionellales bacterium]|nr:threonine--tRNA ligase [Legionellales bacterium]
MRHSCAHVMAAAIQTLWPKAQFGVGPTTENGFYYDVLVDSNITEDDLARIETAMRKIRKKKHRFVRSTVPTDDAIALMQTQDQPFKVDLLELLKNKGSTAIEKALDDDKAAAVETDASGQPTVTLYQTGDFTDLCRGPHVAHSGEIGQFKLHKLAGAYWRGDEKNPQLQRIYGLCFAEKAQLEAEIERLEQLKLRDHRRLAKILKIYHFEDEIGRGLPLWLPAGMTIRQELEYLAQRYEREDGYVNVATPHIAKASLYHKSGHLPYYKEDMYNPIELDNEDYYLRPMNCPHHHMVYRSEPRSYRDLPVRISEWGQVYRYEKSGALNGLMRVRGFCMNDAHIYCRYDQVKEEFQKVIALHARYYQLFDIEDFKMILALPDHDKANKYSDDKENWEKTATTIREAMDEMGFPYEEEEGEAAFYGPKIDFIIKSALGTEYTISTCQLDFMAPCRFSLDYRGESGEQEPVLVIHRAPLGTHERFIAFLLEHYGGNFPTWLAPCQVKIIPISDRHCEYARRVHDALFATNVQCATGGIRSETDLSNERMQKKIRNAQIEKVPYMVVIGDQEVESDTITVRLRDGSALNSIPVSAFIDRLKTEIEQRTTIETASSEGE